MYQRQAMKNVNVIVPFSYRRNAWNYTNIHSALSFHGNINTALFGCKRLLTGFKCTLLLVSCYVLPHKHFDKNHLPFITYDDGWLFIRPGMVWRARDARNHSTLLQWPRLFCKHKLKSNNSKNRYWFADMSCIISNTINFWHTEICWSGWTLLF